MGRICSEHFEFYEGCQRCNADINSVTTADVVSCHVCGFEYYASSDICPKCSSAANGTRFVFPVIHFIDDAITLEQAKIAFECGADGIFLHSEFGNGDELFMVAMSLKGRYKNKLIGINILNNTAINSLELAKDIGIDMVWSDSPGIYSGLVTNQAHQISAMLSSDYSNIQFFGSVAFKYQPVDPDPDASAVVVRNLGMTPTTSGTRTGHAPSVEKVRSIHAALRSSGGTSLALASGLTVQNVAGYLPFASHYLVSTGVSLSSCQFDPGLLKEFIKIVKQFDAD